MRNLPERRTSIAKKRVDRTRLHQIEFRLSIGYLNVDNRSSHLQHRFDLGTIFRLVLKRPVQSIEGVRVGVGRGDDDIGICRVTGKHPSVMAQANGDFPEGIDPGRHRLYGKLN